MAFAVRPLRGSAVELSWKLLIAAAQPYQTLAGPALSVNFMLQPSLLPFQRLPFHQSGVPDVYFHSLLQSLAEFATVPRHVRGSHVRMLHAPMEDFWHTVGLLNCVYSTVYTPFNSQHPVMGAVELASPSHRKQKDVRLSLYSSTHQVAATMVITGTSGDTHAVHGSNIDTPLPHAGFDEEDVELATALVGDMRRLPCGSILHPALFKRGNQSVGERNEDVVPPWRLNRCIAEFSQVLAEAGLLAPHVAAGNKRRVWTIVAQQTLAHGELLHEEPVDVVSAAPRVFARYRMPPWRHQIGLPLFGAGDAQPLCVALRVEMRQHGSTMLAGTYFLVDVAVES